MVGGRWALKFIICFEMFFSLAVHFFCSPKLMWPSAFRFYTKCTYLILMLIHGSSRKQVIFHFGHQAYSIIHLVWLSRMFCGENCMNFTFSKHLSSARIIFVASNCFSTYNWSVVRNVQQNVYLLLSIFVFWNCNFWYVTFN